MAISALQNFAIALPKLIWLGRAFRALNLIILPSYIFCGNLICPVSIRGSQNLTKNQTVRTRIKICGITSAEIAKSAIKAGADAIGLNFYEPSIRYISIEQAQAINQQVTPFVHQVGVFANAEKAFVESVIKNVHLDYLQFHGDESEDYCKSFGRRFIKTIRVAESTDLLEQEGQYPQAEALLLDTYVADALGGTGKTFQWDKSQYGGNKPIILAGGLTPENIQMAISSAKPYAVDLSSGVETNGKKDPEKIHAFCLNVMKCM